MRRFRFLPVFIVMFVFAMMGAVKTSAKQAASAPQNGAQQAGAPRPNFILSVAGMSDGGILPLKNTFQGGEVSPGISWTAPPKGTVSLVLSIHDLNATREHTNEYNIQWLVWNIPVTDTGIPEGVKEGAQLPNGAFQVSGSGFVYRGPGRSHDQFNHHFVFELFAVDRKVDVPGGGQDASDTQAKIMDELNGHIIAKSAYVAMYHRAE